MNEEEYEDAWDDGEEVPAAGPQKSEADLMREESDAEYEDGWGLFPDGDDGGGNEGNGGAAAMPVRSGSVAASDLAPIAESAPAPVKPTPAPAAEMGWLETYQRAKANGDVKFMWGGREFDRTGNDDLPAARPAAKKPAATARVPAAAAPRQQSQVLTEDEADARQLAAQSARRAVPAPEPVPERKASFFPNNVPRTNIYANAGPSSSASPETKAARVNLAAGLKGKNSMAEVMAGAARK